ncbi:unnamed protein product [Sphagnum troendelagicum]|uniref:Protein kinase domain-containing protein n=1 Tax=Sphagnum troendelagicum TaxID=128251 RepID=A0ABP0UGZ7_9BRYO
MQTRQLTEKIDVYSFGVVLLEFISSKQPFIQSSNLPLVDWVRSQMEASNIKDVIDKSFGSNYNPNTIWRVSDTAMRCIIFLTKWVSLDENEKHMRIVLQELHDAMELETSQSPNRSHHAPSEVELSTSSSVLPLGPLAR